MFMQEYQGRYSVTRMAKELGVSRSGYYAWLLRKPSRREQEDRELLQLIIQIFESNYGRYGSPRVWQELVNEFNLRISRKRVERLMKEHGLRAKGKKKYITTTDSRHSLPAAENLLNREFRAEGPGEKWVSDITYLRTNGGWLYLTVVLDLWDRKVIGWNIAENMLAENQCEALKMACGNRPPMKGLFFHSDRGAQYCSELFRKTLMTYCPGVRQSMSRKGNCWDNACAETFFKTLKWELEILDGRHARKQVRSGVFEYIEIYYNRRRRHSALGYATPLALTTSKAA
jgi:transposase InsO family protein